MKRILFLVCVLLFGTGIADEVLHVVDTAASVRIEQKQYPYKATVGTLLVKNPKGEARAHYSFTYYRVVDEVQKRPLTFCFNGGPGSSSVWLHLGAFGPKRWDPAANKLEQNPACLLNKTDLVFIDPVGTGWSRPVEGLEEKQFWGIDEDAEELSYFIQNFLAEFNRWDSSYYLMGESYGAFRIVELAKILEQKFFLPASGLVFVSPLFDMQTIQENSMGNKLPLVLVVPSMSLVAQKKGKLSAPFDTMTTDQLVSACQSFCFNTYLPALYKGDAISAEERNSVAQKLSSFIGISQEDILAYDLQVDTSVFRKKLAANEDRQLGNFDGRSEGFCYCKTGERCEWDPSMNEVIGPITFSLNKYLRNDLGWKGNEHYEILKGLFYRWNWYGDAEVMSLGKIGYPRVSSSLRATLVRHPETKLFIACGYYDLVTPFSSSEYSINQMFLPAELRKKIRFGYYEGGHMMYLDKKAAQKLHSDLSKFY